MMLLVTSAYADDKPSFEKPIPTLDTVEVPALSVNRGSKITNMDVSTTVISREELEKRPELYIDQIVNKELGVWTTQTPSTQVDPSNQVVGIRGFGQSNGEKVLVMMDGVPINDAYYKTIDWNAIPKDNIERIEIVRGGGAAGLWGNLAEGGVINIVTREPQDDEAHLQAKYGSFNTRVIDGSATLFHGENAKIGLTMNSMYTDGYNMTPSQSQLNLPVNLSNPYLASTSSSHSNNAQLSSYYSPNDDMKFYVKLNGSQFVQDVFQYTNQNNTWNKYDYKGGGEIKYSDTGSVNINTFYNYSQLYKNNGGFASGTFSTTVRPFVGTASGIANQTGIYRNTDANAVGYVTQNESLPYQSGGGSVFASDSFDFGGYGKIKDFKAGIDYRGISASDAMNLYSPNARSGTNPYSGLSYVSSVANNSARNMFEGIFAQGTYSPFDIPLDITLGLRMDWWQAFNGQMGITNYNQNGSLSSSAQTSVPNQYFNQFNPRIGFKYGAMDGLSLRGAIYRNYAAPSMNYLYRTSYSSGALTLGNPQLAPESNFGQEIGFDFTMIPTVKWSSTLFRNTLNNYVDSGKVCSTTATCASYVNSAGLTGLTGVNSVTQRFNAGQAMFVGAESSIEWATTKDIDLNFGITFVSAYLSSFNSSFAAANNLASSGASGVPIDVLHQQLGNVQPMVITAGGKWRMDDYVEGLSLNWLLKSWGTYYSSTVHQETGNPSNNPNNVSNAISAATVADLGVTYKANKQVELSLMAQNIGNKSYLSPWSNPNVSPTTIPTLGMPFNLMGGVKIDF